MTVIILTGETRHAEVDCALKLGARAVVSKSDPPEAILAACDAALAGEVYVSPQMVEALGKYRQPPVALSTRQMAILHYLAHGERNKEIAYRLSIAHPTASFHIAALCPHLEVSTQPQNLPRSHDLRRPSSPPPRRGHVG